MRLSVSHVGFSHLDVMLVECYDPKADQWNILQTPILEGRSGPGCTVFGDNIFLVGGYSWSMVRPDTSFSFRADGVPTQRFMFLLTDPECVMGQEYILYIHRVLKKVNSRPVKIP